MGAVNDGARPARWSSPRGVLSCDAVAVPPHFPPPGAAIDPAPQRADDGPYREPATSDEAPPSRIDADDVEWIPGPARHPVDVPSVAVGAGSTGAADPARPVVDPELARMLAATAALEARAPDPWLRRLVAAPVMGGAWYLRGFLGTTVWVLISATVVVLFVLDLRRAWRASDLDR